MAESSSEDRKAAMRELIGQSQGPEPGGKIGIKGALIVLVVCGLASAVVSGAWRFLWDFSQSSASAGEDLTVATYYIRANTEALSFDPVASLDHGWVLPRGTFTVMPDDDALGCEPAPRPDTSDCRVETQKETVLRVRGDARIRLDATATGLAITLLPAGNGEFTATVSDGTRTVATTRSLLSFETSHPNAGMRLPLIVSQALLGSSLFENVTISGDAGAEGGDSWQPLLIDGSYRVVAGIGNRQGRDSFTVLTGDLGPGDLVSLGPSCGTSGAPDGSVGESAIRGVASIGPLDGKSRPVIGISLNACVPISLWSRNLPAITVQRFGGTAPSTLTMPSLAVILGSWPQWVSFWVTFLASMALAQFCSGIAGYARKPARTTSPAEALIAPPPARPTASAVARRRLPRRRAPTHKTD